MNKQVKEILKPLRVGIVGISGYSGLETLEILLNHPHVRVTYVSANNTEGKVTDIWPRLKGRTPLVCKKYDPQVAVALCDVVFLAVPHTVSMTIAGQLLEAGKKVIDLSGDFRLESAVLYKKWYKTAHTDKDNLKEAVYGLPELYREAIKKANLIANPGCYPTAGILALAPFLAIHANKSAGIIIDAKSGVSGAGRKAAINLSHGEVNENFKAYKVLQHQHAPEIELYCSKLSGQKITTNFVPHLLPLHRGILETIYISLNEAISLKEVHNEYKRFYKTEPFVRVLDLQLQPELKNVAHTNYCDIALAYEAKTKTLVITSVIDNLRKGAAGQAVQNMNLMCGFDEQEALL